MSEKIKAEVIINGRRFTIVTQENEEYTKEIANYVDKTIKDITVKNSKLDPIMTATLAAINITDEYYQSLKQIKELERKLLEPQQKYEENEKVIHKQEEIIKLSRIENQKFKAENETLVIENEKLFEQIKKYKMTHDSRSAEVNELKDQLVKLSGELDKNIRGHIELKRELEGKNFSIEREKLDILKKNTELKEINLKLEEKLRDYESDMENLETELKEYLELLDEKTSS